jgi:hypothetical protein
VLAATIPDDVPSIRPLAHIREANSDKPERQQYQWQECW